jgi:hypothetical protein
MRDTFYQDLINAMEAWMDSEEQTIKDAKYMKRKPKILCQDDHGDAHPRRGKAQDRQQMVIDSLTKEAVSDPDEFAPLKEVLSRHIVERRIPMRVGDPRQERQKITRYLLSYLGADEAGHREVVGKLNELKLATIQIS